MVLRLIQKENKCSRAKVSKHNYISNTSPNCIPPNVFSNFLANRRGPKVFFKTNMHNDTKIGCALNLYQSSIKAY